MLSRSAAYFWGQLKVHEVLSSPALQIRCKAARYKRRSAAVRKRFLREDASMEWAKPILELVQEEQAAKASESAKEPHMLHVVRRVAAIVGRPWWEKDIIEKFGLTESMHMPKLVKNTPENNKLLNEIKHLVEIQPLTFPHGMPEHESDFAHSYINSRGEMIVQKRLTPEADPLTAENPRSQWQLDVKTIQTQLIRTRLNFDIHSEYYKTEYEYKLNQDGKEHRYKDFWRAVAEQKKKSAANGSSSN